ncbi:MAG: hypothetical protein ABJA02_09905 [Acidobacteriota bacterium]
MMKIKILSSKSRTFVRVAAVALCLAAGIFAQGPNPVIIIPGLTGSQLVNKNNGQTVWFRISKAKPDDLRLPIARDIDKMHDSLVPKDILREVKIRLLPKYDVYGGLIESMVDRGGYHEESWESGRGAPRALYVFAYDWRLDNVANARLLVRKIAALKRRLRKPNLKFDVIAHSMGGIIARYAAMYGDAPLPADGRKPVSRWAGGRNFDKIILLGTPNEGSVLALNSLLNGLRLGGIKIDLPFVRDMTKFDVFTIPSAFQLLPAPGTLHAYDENLKPIDVDLYDTKTWEKYGWDPFGDKGYEKAFKPAERAIARTYFSNVLGHARRLYEALGVEPRESKFAPSVYLLGSDCKDALDSIVIFQDKGDKWKTLFKPSGFTNAGGVKIDSDDVRKVMYGPGDGTVTRRSFEGATEALVASFLMPKSSKFVCEEHDRLQLNPEIQDDMITILTGKVPVDDQASPEQKPAGKDKKPAKAALKSTERQQ